MKFYDILEREEHIPYDSSIATKLARQLLGGTEGNTDQAKKMADAFAKKVHAAIDEESKFFKAKVVKKDGNN